VGFDHLLPAPRAQFHLISRRHPVDFVDPQRSPIVYRKGHLTDHLRHLLDHPWFVGLPFAIGRASGRKCFVQPRTAPAVVFVETASSAKSSTTISSIDAAVSFRKHQLPRKNLIWTEADTEIDPQWSSRDFRKSATAPGE